MKDIRPYSRVDSRNKIQTVNPDYIIINTLYVQVVLLFFIKAIIYFFEEQLFFFIALIVGCNMLETI